jgi:hypothetical protein
LVTDSKLPARSIHFFLFVDALVDLLQFEPDGGHGVTMGTEVLPREVSFLATQSGYGYRNYILCWREQDCIATQHGKAEVEVVEHHERAWGVAFVFDGVLDGQAASSQLS